MKVKFLGTGTSQGIPVIGCKCNICISKNAKDKRLRTSVYIEKDDYNFIIDTGPDLRQQVLKNNINKLDFVLYTHAHKKTLTLILFLRTEELKKDWFGNKEKVGVCGATEIITSFT